MDANISSVATSSIPGHAPWCKCVRCKVGLIDRTALHAIPLTGTCQRCRKVITNVQPNAKCIYCGYGGG